MTKITNFMMGYKYPEVKGPVNMKRTWPNPLPGVCYQYGLLKARFKQHERYFYD